MINATQARSNANTLLVGGIIVMILGGVIMGLTWPHDDISTITGDIEEHGTWIGFTTGAVIAAAAQLAAIVGLIAHGVHLGLTMSGHSGSPAQQTHATDSAKQRLRDNPPAPDRSYMDEDGQ